MEKTNTLSKFRGLEGKTIGDLMKKDELEKAMRLNPEFFEDLDKSMKKIMKHEAEKHAQPFITNDLLQHLIKSQTPKLVNYTILILSAIALLVGLWALFKSY